MKKFIIAFAAALTLISATAFAGKKEKVNPALIFGYWNMEEVRKYEPELDIAEIKKLFVVDK